MGMLAIKKKDMNRVNLYVELSGAIVNVDGGYWVVSTPDDTLFYDTTAELMEDINENLDIMKEIYTENGELEEWKAAEKRTAKW